MELGAFSVSLAVKDLAASRAFYEALGFEAFHGEATQGWLILRNGAATIGLFQGMFERNILTFNPGWDSDAKPLDAFTDVREIQRNLKASGIGSRWRQMRRRAGRRASSSSIRTGTRSCSTSTSEGTPCAEGGTLRGFAGAVG